MPRSRPHIRFSFRTINQSGGSHPTLGGRLCSPPHRAHREATPDHVVPEAFHRLSGGLWVGRKQSSPHLGRGPVPSVPTEPPQLPPAHVAGAEFFPTSPPHCTLLLCPWSLTWQELGSVSITVTESTDFGVRPSWTLLLALPHTHCVSPSKLLNVSEPQGPPLQKGRMVIPSHKFVRTVD